MTSAHVSYSSLRYRVTLILHAIIIIVENLNASSLDYKSGVLFIYYTSNITYERIRLKVNKLEERELILLREFKSRLVTRDHLNDYIYNDMRRIRTEALLLYVMK